MGFSWGVSFFNFIKWNDFVLSNELTSFGIINAAWHTPDQVCDDSFGSIDAQSACYTLGYSGGGSFRSYHNTDWSEPEIPFLMDDVECESASTNFLSCSSRTEDCDHTENVLLICYASGKGSLALWK